MAKTAAPQYDKELVHSVARGRWVEILSALGKIDSSLLDGKPHPCPQSNCGGKDRFRMIDESAGALFCNKCFPKKNGDGFSALEWLLGIKFYPALVMVAEYLGISAENAKPKKDKKKYASFIDALTAVARGLRNEHLHPQKQVSAWMYHTAAGDEAMAVARYHTSKNGLPGKTYRPFSKSDAGWTIGDPPGKLPIYNLPVVSISPRIVIVEGEKCADITNELCLVATTSAHGSKSFLKSDWSPLAGKQVTIIPDNDAPGMVYSSGVAAILSKLSPPADVAVKLLPGLAEGGDIADFIQQRRSEGISDDAIASEIESIRCQPVSAVPIEHDDDPHRLARVNMDRYGAFEEGATIRFWRDEWYTWKPTRACYRKIPIEELRAKVSNAIKAEFDRINIAKQMNPQGDEIQHVQKVTKTLVSNVIDAMKGLTVVPSSVEMMSWLGGQLRERRNYIAMHNGILDLDRLILDNADDTITDVLLPHSHEWFSTIRLPYDFDMDATCPRWEAFLERNLEMDPEKIKQLQEWAGYLLLPDTGQQKFLALEGEGANGKSVYIAAMTAMIGIDNCSSVSIELLGDKFARTQTIGKLANVCPDAGEIDKTKEGDFKSFVSGDVMFFDRKNLSGLNCTPTARMMMAFNTRPRWSDRSMGIWRRMLHVPFSFTVPEVEQIENMDKYWWWNASGELPGILLWAIQGLHRLRKQKRFTKSVSGDEATEDWREENNPARIFLKECLEIEPGNTIRTSSIYKIYKAWADFHGYRPLGDRAFAKEIPRVFPNAKRVYRGFRGDRFWCYEGLAFSQDEICGHRTAQEALF